MIIKEVLIFGRIIKTEIIVLPFNQTFQTDEKLLL